MRYMSVFVVRPVAKGSFTHSEAAQLSNAGLSLDAHLERHRPSHPKPGNILFDQYGNAFL
jgi:hypothetical protein